LKVRNNMRTKLKIIILICTFAILSIVYIVFDYTNFLSRILVNINNINIDLLSIFFTNLVVILLYIITYFIVDQKKTLERKNKKEIMKYMIKDDYKTCLRYLNILEDKKQLKLIVDNINSEEVGLYKNDYFNKWMDVSFKNYNDIMQYSNQGIVAIYILEQYLYIKSEYSHLMTGYVLIKGMPKEVEKIIDEGHQNLKKVIKMELEKIEGMSCE